MLNFKIRLPENLFVHLILGSGIYGELPLERNERLLDPYLITKLTKTKLKYWWQNVAVAICSANIANFDELLELLIQLKSFLEKGKVGCLIETYIGEKIKNDKIINFKMNKKQKIDDIDVLVRLLPSFYDDQYKNYWKRNKKELELSTKQFKKHVEKIQFIEDIKNILGRESNIGEINMHVIELLKFGNSFAVPPNTIGIGHFCELNHNHLKLILGGILKNRRIIDPKKCLSIPNLSHEITHLLLKEEPRWWEDKLIAKNFRFIKRNEIEEIIALEVSNLFSEKYKIFSFNKGVFKNKDIQAYIRKNIGKENIIEIIKEYFTTL